MFSDENVFNLGLEFTSSEQEFFTLTNYKQDKTWVKDNKVAEFRLFMDNDTYEYKREVYTIWELFGDIGGLNEIAVIFAGIMMTIKSLLFGSGLE